MEIGYDGSVLRSNYDRAIELQPDDGPRSSLGIGPGSDDAVGPRQEFARRFTEGIGKLARNTLGDHRKKTIGLTIKIPKVAGLSRKILVGKSLGLVFTQRRLVVDTGVPQEVGLGSGRRPVGVEPL
ncbi:hypothetical protein GW17_00041891 [Ensete ventricosum]|nr:hypothetical protein GW17_00041891 [Ensete ventricosum]